MSAITFKRGDTFKLTGIVKTDGVAANMTGWTIKAQVRRKGNLEASGFISEVTGSWIDATAASLQLLDDTTADWPIGSAEVDVRLTSPASFKVTTSTQQIEIIESVTRD